MPASRPRATSISAARWASPRTRRSGFRDIRLSFDIDGDLTEEQRATLMKLTERYCVVYQTLRNAPPIAVTSRMA